MHKKAFTYALLVAVIATGVYFLFSRYLVSRLDGTGGVTAPKENTLQYASEEGYSFMYPDTYELSSRTQTSGGMQWDTLVLLPRGYVPPEAGEGPPAISVASYNNAEGLPLKVFLQNEPRTNWGLIVDERATRPMVVGGKPAIWYHYSGLYEVDSVAVAHNNRVYVFSGDWLEPNDSTRTDFNNLIKTVQFN